jgi:hypothetical protein
MKPAYRNPTVYSWKKYIHDPCSLSIEINTKGAFTGMKTECKENELQFQDIEKKVVADFQGGTITSDTGILFSGI